ncbi:MAG: thiamine phosphate synthase [Methylophilaceae bacterium]|nr:thiamine phosphate synthase [Methylophilaceae bacterium]
MQRVLKGLYAITPDLEDTDSLLKRVEAVLRGGAALLQYRNKTASYELKRTQAAALLELCKAYAVPFIINDHVSLCVELDADGVHLGQSDVGIAAARQRLGARKIIGASCYDRLDLVAHAQAQGATYIALGACFDSKTKPAATRVSLDLFGRAKRFGLPVVAIGGITPHNAAKVIEAGADAIAVIGALFDAPEPERAAQTFTHLFVHRPDHDLT